MEFTLNRCVAQLMTPACRYDMWEIFCARRSGEPGRRANPLRTSAHRRESGRRPPAMVWFIALGSAAGGMARFLIGGFIQQRAGPGFPWGTLVVNITGSLLLGFLMRYALASPAVSAEMRGLLTAGFCGGYTTFSTFSYDAIVLLEDGELKRAAAYIVFSVVVSIVGVYLGIIGARGLLAWRERL